MRSIDLEMAALLGRMGGAAYDTAATDAHANARRRGELREVVADVAEDVRDLIAEEDHRDDDRDRDDGDDECIFDETLAFLVTHEPLEHDLLLPFVMPADLTRKPML